MKTNNVYLAVTVDEYELPLFVANNGQEMATWLGIKLDSLYCNISKNYSGRYNKIKVIKVEID